LLALALKIGTVEEMKARMSCREYEGWQTLYGVFPFGEHGLDARFAALTSVTASGLFAGKVKGKFGPEQFSAIRRKRPRRPAQKPDDMKAIMQAAAGRQSKPKREKPPYRRRTI
jgi:hypothetical protein